MSSHRLNILIPTIRPTAELAGMCAEIHGATASPHRIIVASGPKSAAANRNRCLDAADADADLLVMLDDDVSGFHHDWERRLLAPLLADRLTCASSARLLWPDGRVAYNCAQPESLDPRWLEIRPGVDYVMATAAVAFRNLGLRFDETYIGSGFEDGDFWFQHRKVNPAFKFVIVNDCRLVHRNEMKGDQAAHFRRNRLHFHRKWGLR